MVVDMQNIEDFFADRVILLTGTSGFLGRICLEKLLRSCPRIKKIYVLLRNKKDKDCPKRLNELLESIVFESLAKDNPTFKDKVELVIGDCGLPNLALRPETRELLVNEVDVILHWAATVNFDENLKIATNINVRALRDLLKMAKEMPQLKAFLHVSTAFSNCIRKDIDEIFYDTPISGEGLINMMDALDEKLVAEITPNLLGNWPNSYVFTKAVAENLIRDEGRGLPIGIVRPSIVTASYKEPLPGWIDNVYGATGVFLGTALGLIRVMHVNLQCIAEMIPADYVVNTAIASVVDIHHNHKRMMALPDPKVLRIQEAIPIYNIVSSTTKSLTWESFMKLAEKQCYEIPSTHVIWHSICHFTPYYVVYWVGSIFLHIIPAYFVDLLAVCIGWKPKMVKAYQKIHKFANVIAYFSNRQWTFHNENVQKLFIKMQLEDRKEFDFNIAALDWDDYFYYYTRGARRYILRDTPETIPAGKRKLFYLRIAHYMVCAILFYALYQLVNWTLTYINSY